MSGFVTFSSVDGSSPLNLTSTVLVWLLFGALIIQATNILPSKERTILVIGVYGLIYTYIGLRFLSGATITIPWVPVILFGGVTAVFLVNIALGKYMRESFAYFPLYGSFVAVANLFLIPQFVGRKEIFKQLAVFGAILGESAIIMHIVQPAQLWGLFSTTDRNISVFIDSNMFGVAAIATLTAAIELVDEKRVPAVIVLLGGNVAFLLATLSRGAIGAGAIAIAIYAIDRFNNRNMTKSIVYALLAGATTFILAVIFVPRAWVVGLPLTGRQYLWRATVRAVMEVNPLLGAGFVNQRWFLIPYQEGVKMRVGPHNSFLIVLLRGGIVAVGCYAALLWESLIQSVRVPKWRVSSATVALTVGVVINLFIEHHTMWGVAIHVVVIGLTFGYLIAELTEESHPTHMSI